MGFFHESRRALRAILSLVPCSLIPVPCSLFLTRGFARARESSRGRIECRELARRGSIYLLMFEPLRNVEVTRPIVLVEPNHPICHQLAQPRVNLAHSVLVIRVEKAREESRGCASPPVIIARGPQTDEQKPSLTAQSSDALAHPKLRLYAPDSHVGWVLKYGVAQGTGWGSRGMPPGGLAGCFWKTQARRSSQWS